MTIIVGTDGTDAAASAVVWAAAEATRRRTTLRIVHAFEWDWPESRFDIGNEDIDVSRLLADAVVAAAEKRAHAAAPDLTVETGTLIGPAVPQLLAAARDAELLVLGGHGSGHTSRRLATHATSPVVVVRGPATADGPVAAGVDNSTAADHVLRTAFEAAAAQGGPLVVIRSFRPPVPPWLAHAIPAHRTAEQDATERAFLADQVEPWRAKYPEVAVETVLTYDSPAEALTAASRWARLVVIGARGHGVITGTLIGSTGVHLLRHAASPVLIAHEGSR